MPRTSRLLRERRESAVTPLKVIEMVGERELIGLTRYWRSIRVTGVSDEDEDWMLGESMDGERKGGFPRVSGFVVKKLRW
jgi:hypothetical protein